MENPEGNWMIWGPSLRKPPNHPETLRSAQVRPSAPERSPAAPAEVPRVPAQVAEAQDISGELRGPWPSFSIGRGVKKVMGESQILQG